ncbi:disease resistance protein Pik-2 [Setaria viridis]|uniref:disease resistance protein Pik-2 n=1 Tax=Setaria viridis TaxID=4556 RepID=UPI003B3B2472
MSAATTAAAAAMSAVLPKLAALLQEEDSKLQRGRQQDVVFLRDELQQLHGSLEAAAESQGGDSHLEECSRKLRDLFFDVEDSVDGFLRRAGRKQPGPKTKPPPRGFGRFADKAMDLTAGAMRRRRFAEQLRGLRSRLEEVEEPRSNGGDDDDSRGNNLIGCIRKCLQGKRYLVVLDGIWNPEAWIIIRASLPQNDLGSRVITTTCSTIVAKSCSSNCNSRIYNINTFGLGDCRTLFHGRIFGSVGSYPPDLADVADRILIRCAGFPLAIAAISSLLACKPRARSVWEDVCNCITASPRTTEGMRRILSLGYHDLPHHLKVCLWHLSIFPADYPIDHDRVIRSWMAEGLVWEKSGKTVEEVGESYLEELMDRQMIQLDHGSHDGEAKAYVLSSMMLEIIRFESVQENFVTVLENGKPASVSSSKIRRLSIISFGEVHDIDIPASSVTMSRIRSLYIFGNAGKKLTFKNLTFLRVLDLQGCKDLKNHNVKEIAGLRDLRYLSIRDTRISEIPDQIAQLQNLTTLDLRGTEVQELPASVLQLQRQRLAHLLFDDKMRFPSR